VESHKDVAGFEVPDRRLRFYDDMLKKEMKAFDEDYDIEKTFLAEIILGNHKKKLS
jgi:hypothetical protein